MPKAADTIAAIGEIAVDTVTIYRDIVAFGQTGKVPFL